jgi:hypothetical protein
MILSVQSSMLDYLSNDVTTSYLEDGGSRILRNIGNYIPLYRASNAEATALHPHSFEILIFHISLL